MEGEGREWVLSGTERNVIVWNWNWFLVGAVSETTVRETDR